MAELAVLHEQDQLTNLSDEELLLEIRRRMVSCAESLVALAGAVGPAVRRGLDLSFMNPLLVDVLRRIESRQVDPVLAERFMHMRVFQRLKSLPMDDQRTIASSGIVEIVVRRGDRFDTRMMPIDALTTDQASLVFSKGRVRSKTEMIAVLESRGVIQDDPFDDAKVVVKVSAEIEMTKAQRRKFNEIKDKAGGPSKLITSLILRRLRIED